MGESAAQTYRLRGLSRGAHRSEAHALHATALSRAPTPYPTPPPAIFRCEDSTPDDSASTSSRLEAKYLSQLSTLEGSSPSRVGSKRGLDEDDEMSGAAARLGQRTR